MMGYQRSAGDPASLDAQAARALLRLRQPAYAQLSPELVIGQTSAEFEARLQLPGPVAGQPLPAVLWEFAGLETALGEVVSGRWPALVLDRINRETAAGSTAYLRFEVVPLEPARPGAGLLLLVEDVTTTTELEQRVMQDRNELRLAQAQLAQANTELERLSDFKTFLISMVAHDLRSPLAAVSSYTELSLEEVAPAEGTDLYRYLKLVQLMAGRMDRMIDNLLDLDQLERGHLRIRRRPCDLQPVLTQVVHEFQVLIRFRNLTVTLDWPAGVPPVHADPERMFQVFYNLISNAVKYTPDGGVIRVAARAVEAQTEVAITNTGRGLTEAQLANMFRLYYRTDEARRSKIAGTGLGLYIVKTLVEAHGGSVRTVSRLGEEVTFVVALPVASDSA